MAAKKKLPPGIDQPRPGGKYRARYRDGNGNLRTVEGGPFDTVTAAKQALTLAKASVLTGTHINPRSGDQTFMSFSHDDYAPAQDWKAGTRRDFPYSLNRIEKVLPKNIALKNVDMLVIKKARVDLQRLGYKDGTVTLTMSYLQAIMRAAYAAKRIPSDPTVGAKSKRRKKADNDTRVKPEDVPTRDEVLMLLDVAPPRFRAALALGMMGGLRIGEVLGMTADRLDLEHRWVTVDRQAQRLDSVIQHTSVKTDEPRTIRVPRALVAELRAHPRSLHAGGLLFPTLRSGRPLSRDEFYQQAWYPALRNAGLERRYKFHSLRHFCASSMIADGKSLTAVAGYIGDNVTTLTRVYAHWLRDDVDVPADALDEIFTDVSRACHDEVADGS